MIYAFNSHANDVILILPEYTTIPFLCCFPYDQHVTCACRVIDEPRDFLRHNTQPPLSVSRESRLIITCTLYFVRPRKCFLAINRLAFTIILDTGLSPDCWGVKKERVLGSVLYSVVLRLDDSVARTVDTCPSKLFNVMVFECITKKIFINLQTWYKKLRWV